MTTRAVAAARRSQRPVPTVEELRALGMANGLDAVGVAGAEPFLETRRHLQQRRAAGLHAGMGFTYRDPERCTDPGRLLRSARSLVVGAYAYLRAEPAAGEPEAPRGRVARYAWDDHYAALRAGLDTIAGRLRADGWRAVVVADQNSLVDRAAAHRAGLGWYGKNSNLLLPGKGSWFVLGSVVTDAALEPAAGPEPDGCGGCRRCLDGCPTGAIVAPGVVDAGRCLAWLVQAPGVFPPDHREALGARIYGCDDCQEVCPPNRRAEVPVGIDPTPAGAPPPRREAWVPLLELLAATDAELLDRWGRWYVHDRDPRWLRRNALLALGNVGDPSDPAVVTAVGAALRDRDPLLRAHAVWAARRLGPAAPGLELAVEAMRRDRELGRLDDPDGLVAAELDRPTTPRLPRSNGGRR